MGFFEKALNYNNGGKGFFIGDKVYTGIIIIIVTITSIPEVDEIPAVIFTTDHLCRHSRLQHLKGSRVSVS